MSDKIENTRFELRYHELQEYLSIHYPDAQLDTEHTLGGPFELHFDLGGDLAAGSIERIHQASERALKLFVSCFPDKAHPIWFLNYGYSFSTTNLENQHFFETLFEPGKAAQFYQAIHTVNTRYETIDEFGNECPETAETRITIGLLPLQDIHFLDLLFAILNADKGFQEGLDGRTYFIDPRTHVAFMINEDRTCVIWSKAASDLHAIYKRFQNWIKPYHLAEAKHYFNLT